MQNDVERNAIAIIVVFGALIIGGLMGAAIGFGDRTGFLFALGSATAAWLSGYAMILTRPRLFGLFIVLAVLFSLAATFALVR